MNNRTSFNDILDAIADYRKIVLLRFLFKIDDDLLRECGFLKIDINLPSLEFEFILMEQNEEYLDCIKNEEESILEKILDK